MNKTRLCAAILSCFIAAPVFAQSNADQHLRTTLEGMNDGVEIGGSVVEYVKDKGVKLEFGTQNILSLLANDVTVRLSSDLPDHPQILGPLIAREVSRLMLADMPSSAEKEYMRLSLQVRTWLELGGDKDQWPLIGGYKAEALADEFKVWFNKSAETALEKVGQTTKTKYLAVLIDEHNECMKHRPACVKMTPEGYKRAQEKLAALKAADKKFRDFMWAERDWRLTNKHLLPVK